jgi:ornithine carbamoyltransferase
MKTFLFLLITAAHGLIAAPALAWDAIPQQVAPGVYAFVGDTGSNMGRSFAEGAGIFGYQLKLAYPKVAGGALEELHAARNLLESEGK